MARKELLEPGLVKFMFTAAACLFVGTVQGALQTVKPIREWLVSIGTPMTNPGHMIDPLAHAHLNLVGGVVLFMIGMIYYHVPRMSGKPIYSQRLVEHTFWWITIGVSSFYISLMTFGIWEGNLMLAGDPFQQVVHSYYIPVISTCATIMTVGYAAFFINLAMTIRQKPSEEAANILATEQR